MGDLLDTVLANGLTKEAPSSKNYAQGANFTPSALKGVIQIEMAPKMQVGHSAILETYNRNVFRENGIDSAFVQDAHVWTAQNVLLGLHYQDLSAPMGKLVRCIRGAVFDVQVDLRVDSPTFGSWSSVELDDQALREVWIPAGFAHGYMTLSTHAEVLYRVTGNSDSRAHHVLAWNDPTVGIVWPMNSPLLDDKDSTGMSWDDYLRDPHFHI